MKAIQYDSPGEASVLYVTELDPPTCRPHEVLIRVKASGINRPDIFQRRGNYNAPAGTVQNIPGLEVSGTVTATGSHVSRLNIGDDVCAILSGGGYSDTVCVDERLCMIKPSNLSFTEAASLPETVLTVWHNVFQRGGLSKDESILVHGGSGGIGITAIQLARIFGKQVYVTAGSDEKCNACVNLGATEAINYQQKDFEKVLQDKTIDIILDMIGGSYFAKNIRLLNTEGRLIYINAMEGAKVELNIMEVMKKRLTISGSTLRSRTIEFKGSLCREVEKYLWPKIEQGQFVPVIDRTFSYEKVGDAHRYLENGQHFGKIVLTW